MNLLKFHVAVVSICLSLFTPAFANPIGSVVSMEGQASAERAGDTVPLAINSDIQVNDRIVTKEKSKVQIRFIDDSVMSLGENSDVVMDEYVFDASRAGENSFGANLGNGIFRVVSGKIVELNPDRFKVKTSRSTIGIRGCDLGFLNNENSTQVLIISIPPGHEILIGEKSFKTAGRSVSINNNGDLDDQPLDPDSMKKFEESTGSEKKGDGNPDKSANGEQDENSEEQEDEQASQEGDEQSDLLTEGELIEVLVNTLGLATMLPPSPNQADMMAILMQNGIVPADGWDPDRVVTLGNLARVLVQTLGQSDMVENPEDDASWVNYLLSLGLDLSTIEAAVGQVPSADPNAGYSDARQSFDPSRRYPFSQPFSGAGFTVQTFRDLIIQITPPPVPPPPRPVTPN